MHKSIFIMSIYSLDKRDFIKRSIDSMLAQTINNIYIYIAVDGIVDKQITSLLSEYQKIDNVKIFYFNENKGLAFRLNQLIDIAMKENFHFIARMDADDICREDRIEKQINYLIKNKNISIVGSNIIEIDNNENYICEKKMDTDPFLITKNIIKKCPLNHPSVMFRSSVFESGLRYNNKLKNTQDYYLWVDAIKGGFNISNINESLLYFRIDENFFSRRGLKKAINDVKSRIYAMNKLKKHSIKNYFFILFLFIFRLSPKFIKIFGYKNFRNIKKL
ncbi:glycosyltransferase [Proteus mirabilis]|uniref:glycosyltransferase n=1 Tax=Proteus mirabilis TaxID=584 RepID=UPI001F04723E|nr:glycosyltransferase [Proteus mirabilis]